VFIGFAGPHDVNDRMAGGFEVIRNERAMALPPERFGAHDGGAFLVSEFEQTLDARAKFRSHHEIRVAAECFVPPNRVGRIRQGLATAAEFRKMNVADANLRQ